MVEKSCYFDDGIRKIDFVLAYRVGSDEGMAILDNFLHNLSVEGYLEVEKTRGKHLLDIVFVKIHAGKTAIEYYTQSYNIDLLCENTNFSIEKAPIAPWMQTPLHNLTEEDELYSRAPEAFSRKRPQEITSMERILVVEKILNITHYGHVDNEYGYKKLLKTKILLDAYPLHDSNHKWTETGPLSDRQLLAKFWSPLKYFYKEQPTWLIEKYFGPEVGFYFAWLGFYTKLLTIPTIIGLFCLINGIFDLAFHKENRVNEICYSNITLCPTCLHSSMCSFQKLHESCLYSYISYLDDNAFTGIFAFFVILWAATFMVGWSRKQKILNMYWNLSSATFDSTERVSYYKAAHWRAVPGRGIEFYLPRKKRALARTFTWFVACLLSAIIVTKVISSISIRIYIVLLAQNSNSQFLNTHAAFIGAITSSFFNAILITLLNNVYVTIALRLTELEYHRTQMDFHRSYIYKAFCLSFVNNYTAVLYLSFIRGSFYTHPGNKSLHSFWGIVFEDACDPAGCSPDLTIQLICTLFVKIALRNVAQYFVPIAIKLIKAQIKNDGLFKYSDREISRYESDYYLPKVDKYHITNEYIEILMQYGYVVCFVSAFPLLPLLALINNIFEIRIDAVKLTHHYRRIIPRRVPGIAAWTKALKLMTLLGIATNAFVLGFGSELIPRQIYKKTHDSKLKGFVNSTLSRFNVADFGNLSQPLAGNDSDICFYRGKRYPPEHAKKYSYNKDYWFDIVVQSIFVIIFEHCTGIIFGILMYAVPSLPLKMKRKIDEEMKLIKEAKIKELRQQAEDLPLPTAI